MAETCDRCLVGKAGECREKFATPVDKNVKHPDFKVVRCDGDVKDYNPSEEE